MEKVTLYKNHTTYFYGDTLLKYRGDLLSSNTETRKDVYSMPVYSSEIKNLIEISEQDYNKAHKSCLHFNSLRNVIIEKPHNRNKVFIEDLEDVGIVDYSTHSFLQDGTNYGTIEGKAYFKIDYQTSYEALEDEVDNYIQDDYYIPRPVEPIKPSFTKRTVEKDEYIETESCGLLFWFILFAAIIGVK